jgi:hypothetical protein
MDGCSNPALLAQAWGHAHWDERARPPTELGRPSRWIFSARLARQARIRPKGPGSARTALTSEITGSRARGQLAPYDPLGDEGGIRLALERRNHCTTTGVESSSTDTSAAHGENLLAPELLVLGPPASRCPVGLPFRTGHTVIDSAQRDPLGPKDLDDRHRDASRVDERLQFPLRLAAPRHLAPNRQATMRSPP